MTQDKCTKNTEPCKCLRGYSNIQTFLPGYVTWHMLRSSVHFAFLHTLPASGINQVSLFIAQRNVKGPYLWRRSRPEDRWLISSGWFPSSNPVFTDLRANLIYFPRRHYFISWTDRGDRCTCTWLHTMAIIAQTLYRVPQKHSVQFLVTQTRGVLCLPALCPIDRERVCKKLVIYI